MAYLITPSSTKANYTVEKFTAEDIMVADSGYLSTKIHAIHTCTEINVTPIKNLLNDYKIKHGTAPSMIAVYLYCYGQVLAENKQLHALKSRRNRLYVFNDADVFFPYEIEEKGKKIIARKIIRALNKKTVFEIEAILKDIRNTTTVTTPYYQKICLQLPKWFKNTVYSTLMGMPIKRKDTFGNVYFGAVKKATIATNVSYFFPYHFHSVGLFVHGPFIQPQNNTLHIAVTLSVDHAITNGIGLSNATTRFKYFLENFKLP